MLLATVIKPHLYPQQSILASMIVMVMLNQDPTSSRYRSEGEVIKQRFDTSVSTNYNMIAASITNKTPGPSPGTMLSPTASPVTISYLNDDSHYISTATSINNSSSTPIVTAVIYLNYCASSNAGILILSCGLISKYAHLGNELGQPDVELGQSDVNTNHDGEPPGMNEPSVKPPPDAPPGEHPGHNLVLYIDINPNTTLVTTTLVTATALDSSSLTTSSFPFESEITLSTATIGTTATSDICF